MDIKQIEQIEASLIIALEQIQKIKAELTTEKPLQQRNTTLKLQRKSKYLAKLYSRNR